jgi:hypothetical protein
MIKFEEHDGMLFKMLDKPVPLTPDAEMPCLVRLIQDNSPMGKLNKDLHAKVLTPKICTEVIDVNDLSDHNRGSVRCDGFMSCLYYYYELIGTFVEEGSAEWALYQMMQRNKVTKQHLQDDSGNIYWCFCDMLRCVQEFNCGTLQITVIPEIWINTADKNGWQIYKEPEPQHKVGDWVEWSEGLGISYQSRITRVSQSAVYSKGICIPLKIITRKLKPSQVVVKIGCLSGTVEKSPFPKFEFILATEAGGCRILFDALDAPTRKLVKGLLKAQDEEK